MYDMPELSTAEMQEIIDAPWEVKSDSFFFAEGTLIVHNRAEYNYAPLDAGVEGEENVDIWFIKCKTGRKSRQKTNIHCVNSYELIF